MSIRAEDAAAEASRFSLRTSLFGGGDTGAPFTRSVTQYAKPHHQPFVHKSQVQTYGPGMQVAHGNTQSVVSAQPSPQAGFSFNFISSNRASSCTRESDTDLRNRQTQNTLAAIARIADEQRRRGDKATVSNTAAPLPSLGAVRTLPSGYISGGNTRIDSQAEVMRLTATIDALNSKIASQADRLQRTEASLVKANRSITSERATSNARLLKLQNDLKELRAREAAVREAAVTQARQVKQKLDASSSFEASAKRAEEYDAKIQDLSETVKTLTAEKEAEHKKAVELEMQLSASISDARTARGEIDASEVRRTQANETTTRELSQLQASFDASVSENSRLEKQLDAKGIDFEQVRVELDEMISKHADVSAMAMAAQTRLADAEREIDEHKERVCALLAENNKIKESMTSVSLSCPSDDVGTVTCIDANDKGSVLCPVFDPVFATGHMNACNPILSVDKSTGNVIFETKPFPLKSQCSFDARMVHPVTTRISSAMNRLGHGKRVGPVAGINPMNAYRITRAPFDTDAGSTMRVVAGDTAAGAQVPPEVSALIEAVSKDISHACVQSRSRYLKAVGMSDKDIQKEISAYA
jgi:hypothetical protein